MQQAMLEQLGKGQSTTAELAYAVYRGGDGPEDETLSIHVMIYHIRKKLRAMGLPFEIINRYGSYTLRKINDEG
jgi:hypothetical protein